MEGYNRLPQTYARVYEGSNNLSGQAIQINGDIHGGLRLDGPQPPELKPINRLPNILHSRFSGREKYLSQLVSFFNSSQGNTLKVACIHGNLGLGKTQLALKYGTDNKLAYFYRWYIDGSSQEQYTAGFNSIYDDLYSYRLVPQAEDLNLRRNIVLDWMSSCSKSWLLFIDNSFDLKLLKQHLYCDASSTHANILITTRIKHIATDISSAEGLIELLPMDEQEGEQLVMNILQIPETDLASKEIATKITKAYDGLPLALVPALTTSSQRQWTLEQLLGRISSDANWALEIVSEQMTADDNVEGALALAMDEVKIEHQMLLHLLVLMAPQNLPISFVREGLKGGLDAIQCTSTRARTKTRIRKFFGGSAAAKTTSVKKRNQLLIDFLSRCCQSPDLIEEAVLDLQRAIVRRDVTTGHLWIHDAFCHSLKTNLSNSDREFFAAVACGVAIEALRGADIAQLRYYEKYLPHIVALANYASEVALNAETQARLRYIIGYQYSMRHLSDSALQWYEKALAGQERALGEDHPDTLQTVLEIAFVCKDQGHYDKALSWYKRVLAAREKSLKKNHFETVHAIYGIAVVYSKQGHHDQALSWFKQALAGYEKAFGKNDVNVFRSVHGVAGEYYKQGHHDQALSWFERALAGYEQTLGEDHPDTLNTIHSIAGVYCDQGYYDRALEWFERALAGREKALKKDHPHTLNTVHSIAVVYSNQGHHDQALSWFERALAGYKQTLGEDHPETLNTIHSIAVVYDDQGNYDKALEWYRRALAGRERVLGTDHPETRRTIRCLKGLLESRNIAASSAMMEEQTGQIISYE